MAASGASNAADAVITDTEGSKKDIGSSTVGVDSAYSYIPPTETLTGYSIGGVLLEALRKNCIFGY